MKISTKVLNLPKKKIKCYFVSVCGYETTYIGIRVLGHLAQRNWNFIISFLLEMAFISPSVDPILVLNSKLTSDPGTGYKYSFIYICIRSTGNLPVRVAR